MCMGVRRSDCGGASTATVSDTAHRTAKGDIMATIHDVAIATGVSDAHGIARIARHE